MLSGLLEPILVVVMDEGRAVVDEGRVVDERRRRRNSDIQQSESVGL